MSRNTKPFFVGYLPVPGPLRMFLLGVCFAFCGMMALLAFATGATQDDPGPGAFRGDYGRQTVHGVIVADPYPVLHVTTGNDRIKPGHSMMLAGPGKNGVQNRLTDLQGQTARVNGIVLERGSLDMLQVRNIRPSDADTTAEPVPSEDLGRWRLTGEICDGKCLAGAMRPGRGLAHKACASLCLFGGVPPVFVSSQAVAGTEFLMIGNADGKTLSQKALDHVGAYISVEGQILRQGSMLIFLIDDSTLEVL